LIKRLNLLGLNLLLYKIGELLPLGRSNFYISVSFVDFLSVSFVKTDCSLKKKSVLIDTICFDDLKLFFKFLTTMMPSSQFQKRPCPFVWKEERCTFFVRPKAMYHLMWIGRLSHLALIVGHLKRKTSV